MDIEKPVAEASPAEALRRTPWLRHVPSPTIDRLARQAVLHRVPAGSILFEQSEIPGFAQLLVSGGVELLAVDGTNEVPIETVRPVDLLLPAAVLNQQPYLTRARVLEEAHLVLIHAGVFRDAVASDHALCLAVLACQAAQFRRQVKLAKNLKLRSAEDRVGCYLLRLVEGKDALTPTHLPLEKRRIAGQLGMTRETFSRTLSAMSRHGLHVAGDTITVTDPEALRARFHLDPLIDAPEPVEPIASRRD
ncbi:MAG TPA: helix-turn-helix domain-containing protein [Rhodopila sp.]|uniref:helix-turn-helix domain-containing protein n=1 Tax=Rhodopila sp. TaxID=2480087 RepID=UPI002C5F0FB4|nr:helix-turn-helix domain-containing protein [Rhodopila sp.]HVY18376.1 helix-turn-helix domain-containing protein [Rhodopila sp.]